MRIKVMLVVVGLVALAGLPAARAYANCNTPADMPPYPNSTWDDCSAGDSAARFSWGYYRFSDTFRRYIQASCTGGDCGGAAVIGGYSLDGALLCMSDWTNTSEVFCPDSLAYVIYATIGDAE
jgi:hypothetical protein